MRPQRGHRPPRGHRTPARTPVPGHTRVIVYCVWPGTCQDRRSCIVPADHRTTLRGATPPVQVLPFHSVYIYSTLQNSLYVWSVLEVQPKSPPGLSLPTHCKHSCFVGSEALPTHKRKASRHFCSLHKSVIWLIAARLQPCAFRS
jgi:hypothetical protein